MSGVAVFVPGIMGSVLCLGKKVIWPGPAASLVFEYKLMKQLLDPSLTAPDVIRSFSISKQYQAVIDDLAGCGFDEHAHPPTLYLCPYDWRKDNGVAADVLADTIDRAVRTHGAATEISIVAHSMGGLVSRCYLESGTYNARPGFARVRRLITLGTPHRGAPLALSAALGHEKRLFLSKEQVRTIANDARYPSLYQLLPPAGEPFAWNEAARSELSTLDIYDPTVAATLGLSSQNLAAARTFHAKLDLSRRPIDVRYFFFAGTQQKTSSAVGLLDEQTTPASYRVRAIEQDKAGDGTVPIWSGSITSVQGQPVGGEHGTIYRSDDLRRTLAVLLGRVGLLAARPDQVEVALRERVVKPGATVHAALTFAAGVDTLEGYLVIQRAVIGPDGEHRGYARPASRHAISYAGLDAESLTVVFSAPAANGVYRVAYIPNGAEESAGSDELFVQGVAPRSAPPLKHVKRARASRTRPRRRRT